MSLSGMDIESILDVASKLQSASSQLDRSSRAIDDLVRVASDVWRGPDVEQFNGRWHGQFRRVSLLAAQQLRELAEVARRNAESQRATSETLGGGAAGGLALAVGISLPAVPNLMINVPKLIHDAWTLIDWGLGDDGMAGGRRATDRAVPIRDLPGNNFDNDWAGRAILGRYLDGGDDWTLKNDGPWTDYLQANPTLTRELKGYNGTQAKVALDAYLSTGQTTTAFSSTSSMEMENGESIVGYQYLHGTDANAGGFQHAGSTRVEPVGDGTYRVTVASDYMWNDTIDPNPQYATDNWKNKIAEAITFGRADPYQIHIGWSGTTTMVVDANGNVIKAEGWPN